MRSIFFTISIITFSFSCFAQQKKTPIKKPVSGAQTIIGAELKTHLDSVSYAFGTSIGSSLKGTGLNTFNYDVLLKGLKAAFSGSTMLLTAEQAGQKIQTAIITLKTKDGEKFLAENAKRAGVKTTPTGLQYEILREGTGAKPKMTDSVTVNYKGTLLDGKQFDSSYDRGEPITLSLGGVIAAWTEGLQLMPTGSKYKFYVPYNLGYGERGAGQDIPPYSTLVFEIELLKVNGK